jgi:hypothetical protein
MTRSISVGLNLTANIETVVYKVPKGYYAKWNLMYIHNSGAQNKNISVDWYDQSTNTHIAILAQTPLAAKDYVKFDGNAEIVMEEFDEVHMTAEAGSAFGIICTFELVQQEGFKYGY